MATPVETVRLLSGLTVEDATDGDLDGLLALFGGTVKLAAAEALDVVASQLVDATDPEGLSVKGSARAAVLTARAARLREQAAADADAADPGGGFFFDTTGAGTGRPELTEYESGWRWFG